MSSHATAGKPEGVTISRAAAFAEVTVKTVRHYHRLGLVDEPPRDRSGYRRYDSDHLLRLVQVRTLADAGVPLAEVRDLLDADPEWFADALVDVERRLTARIDELVQRRRTLRRMAAGDRALLPERAAVVLDRLAGLDFDAEYVGYLREAMVLSRALAPEFFDAYLDQLEQRLADPEHVELLRRSWQAEQWDPGDPRVGELAHALADNLLARPEQLRLPAEFRSRPDAVARYAMINFHRAEQTPTAARLTELIEARLRAAGVDVPRG